MGEGLDTKHFNVAQQGDQTGLNNVATIQAALISFDYMPQCCLTLCVVVMGPQRISESLSQVCPIQSLLINQLTH